MTTQRRRFPGTVCAVLLFGGLVPLAAHADEEADIRAVIARNTQGWTSFNADMVASTYAADAVWQNPFGVRIVGPVELKQFLLDLFSRPGYRAAKDTSPPTIQSVRVLGPDAAVVWTEESSTGQTENGKPLGDRHSHYLQVLHRTAKGWLITDDMIMDERPIPSWDRGRVCSIS